MKTDPLDLEINGQLVRIVCEDPDAAALLHDALRAEATPVEAPLGFSLSAPSQNQPMYVLTDRAGYVLARTRVREQALAIIAGHLSALEAPGPDTVRFRTRALAGPGDSVVLAPWPVLYVPPVAERRLAPSGYRLIDRLCIDLDQASQTLCPTEVRWDALRSLDPGPGHLASLGPGPWPVTTLLSLGHEGSLAPTAAQSVHFLASLAVQNQDHAQILDVVEQIGSGIRTRFVPPGDSKALYACLEEDAGENRPFVATSS